MVVRSLTVKERILLHLFDYNRYADEYEVPEEVTQSGIAEAVGIRVPHVSQYVRPLVSEDLVEEWVSHIKQKPRRRKVYFLTHRGRPQAASLRSSLFEEPVSFRWRSGKVEEVPLARVYQEERRGVRLLELIQELAETGAVTEGVPEAVPEPVDFTEEAPSPDLFYGREEELTGVLDGLQQAPIVVVTGLAGIGKSTLGAKVCEALRGERSLFWREVRSWDSATDLARRLAVFLQALGRPSLLDYLSGGGVTDLNRFEEILAGDLAGVRPLLVFDDVHNASQEALNFLSVVHRALKRQDGEARALILSRSVPGFYGLREAELEASVCEVPLKGLDDGDSYQLLTDQGVPAALADSLVVASGGNPLFLQLLARSAEAGPGERGVGSLEAYIAEEIEPSLSEGEREALQLASLYEVPVPSHALLLGPEAEARSIVSLERKNLLDRRFKGRLTIHASFRGYFRKSLPMDRRSALASVAAVWLRKEAETLTSAGSPDEAIALVENALAVEPDGERRLDSREQLAHLRGSVGDWEGAVEACRALLTRVQDPRARAEAHADLAGSLRYLWRLEEAQREVQRGLAVLPSGPSPEAVVLLAQRSINAVYLDRYEEASAALERAEQWLSELPEDPDLSLSWARIMAFQSITNPLRRDPALALRFAKQAIEFFEAPGSERKWHFQGYGVGAFAAFQLGRIDEALALLDHGWEVAQKEGPLMELGNLLTLRAFMLSEGSGEVKEAEELYSEALQRTKRTHEEIRLHWFPRLFANLYRRQGRTEDARESLDYFLATSGESLTPDDVVEGHALMARILSESGDPAAATEHLSKAEALLQKAPSQQVLGVVGWARGVLLGHRGEVEGARESFEQALSVELPPYRGGFYQKMVATDIQRGELLLDYGRFLASVGRKEEAKDVLVEALEEVRRGARKPLENAVVGELRSLEASPPG